MAGDSTQQNNGNSEKVQGLGAVLTVIIFLATVINFLFPEPSQALLLWAKNNPLVAFVFVGLTVVVSWVILSESAPIRHLLAAIWEKLGVILLIAAVFGLVTIILRDSSPPEPTVTLPPMGTETPTTISVSLTPALTETPVPIQVSSTPTAPTLTLTPIIITPTAKNAVATATPADTSVPPPQPWVSNSQYVQCGTVDGQVALVVQTNDEWQTYALRRTYFSVQPGQTVSFKFRLGDADQAGRFGLARQGGGFIGFIFHVGEMYPDYNLGTSRDWPIDGTAVDQRADVWYQANINVDSEGRVTWEVRPENPLSVNQSIFYMLNASSTNAFFKDQSFQFYLHSGTRAGSSTLYLRDYQEGGNRIVLCEGE